MVLALMLTGCQTSGLAAFSPTKVSQDVAPEEPVVEREILSTPINMPTSTPIILEAREEAAEIVESFHCGQDFCQQEYPGWIQRPFSDQHVVTMDAYYPYANTKGGLMEVHHGVEFQNAYGTLVQAVEMGEVVFAGTDDLSQLGLKNNYYGIVVVLRHPGLFEGKDIFTLYGHLSAIDVNIGDWLRQGAPIGEVGASGVADGPHLHFEVRIETNDYAHTSNPALWFSPLFTSDNTSMSIVAGVVMDRNNDPISEALLTLEKLGEDGSVEDVSYLTTYNFSGVNSHPNLGENFVIPDIPAGDYRLSFVNDQLYEVFFTLDPGCLGFISLQVD